MITQSLNKKPLSSKKREGVADPKREAGLAVIPGNVLSDKKLADKVSGNLVPNDVLSQRIMSNLPSQVSRKNALSSALFSKDDTIPMVPPTPKGPQNIAAKSSAVENPPSVKPVEKGQRLFNVPQFGGGITEDDRLYEKWSSLYTNTSHLRGQVRTPPRKKACWIVPKGVEVTPKTFSENLPAAIKKSERNSWNSAKKRNSLKKQGYDKAQSLGSSKREPVGKLGRLLGHIYEFSHMVHGEQVWKPVIKLEVPPTLEQLFLGTTLSANEAFALAKISRTEIKKVQNDKVYPTSPIQRVEEVPYDPGYSEHMSTVSAELVGTESWIERVAKPLKNHVRGYRGLSTSLSIDPDKGLIVYRQDQPKKVTTLQDSHVAARDTYYLRLAKNCADRIMREFESEAGQLKQFPRFVAHRDDIKYRYKHRLTPSKDYEKFYRNKTFGDLPLYLKNYWIYGSRLGDHNMFLREHVKGPDYYLCSRDGAQYIIDRSKIKLDENGNLDKSALNKMLPKKQVPRSTITRVKGFFKTSDDYKYELWLSNRTRAQRKKFSETFECVNGSSKLKDTISGIVKSFLKSSQPSYTISVFTATKKNAINHCFYKQYEARYGLRHSRSTYRTGKDVRKVYESRLKTEEEKAAKLLAAYTKKNGGGCPKKIDQFVADLSNQSPLSNRAALQEVLSNSDVHKTESGLLVVVNRAQPLTAADTTYEFQISSKSGLLIPKRDETFDNFRDARMSFKVLRDKAHEEFLLQTAAEQLEVQGKRKERAAVKRQMFSNPQPGKPDLMTGDPVGVEHQIRVSQIKYRFAAKRRKVLRASAAKEIPELGKELRKISSQMSRAEDIVQHNSIVIDNFIEEINFGENPGPGNMIHTKRDKYFKDFQKAVEARDQADRDWQSLENRYEKLSKRLQELQEVSLHS